MRGKVCVICQVASDSVHTLCLRGFTDYVPFHAISFFTLGMNVRFLTFCCTFTMCSLFSELVGTLEEDYLITFDFCNDIGKFISQNSECVDIFRVSSFLDDLKKTPAISHLSQHSQYKLSYTILNNIKVYEEPVPRTKKIAHHAVKFEAGGENRIVYESFTGLKLISYHYLFPKLIWKRWK